MSNESKGRPFGGRGFSLALGLCVMALGIAGYGIAARRSAPVSAPEQTVPVTEPVSVRNPPASAEPDPVSATEPAPTRAPEAQKQEVGRPLEGEFLAGYCAECLGYNETTRDWRVHPGIDIGAGAGTAVKAAADGEVYTVYEDDQLGTTVVLRHDGGYTTRYASLAREVAVKPGQKVLLGQTIGTVGSTALMESALGDHLHFSVTKNDVLLDPEEFFAG